METSYLNIIAAEIHEWARGKGFYDRDTPDNVSFPSEKLLLVVSEAVEAQSALRDGDEQAHNEEIADAMIRLLDYCGWRGIDIEYEIRKKMNKNMNRPHLHGRTF